MQLFDDPRYKDIRKKYDWKIYTGYGFAIPVMLVNPFIHSSKISIALFAIQMLGLAYVIINGLHFRKELKQLEAVRETEGLFI